MTTIPTPQQILTGAVDLINERGWCQGTPTDEDGALSIVAAMRLATAHAIGITDVPAADLGDRDVWPEATRDAVKTAFDRAASEVVAQTGWSAFDEWAEEEGRTADEVVAVLRAAAEGGEAK